MPNRRARHFAGMNQQTRFGLAGTEIKSRQRGQRPVPLSLGQKFHEYAPGERSQSNGDRFRIVPDSPAQHRAGSQFLIGSAHADRSPLGRIEPLPAAYELPYAHRDLEIIGQYPFQPCHRAGHACEQPGILQEGLCGDTDPLPHRRQVETDERKEILRHRAFIRSARCERGRMRLPDLVEEIHKAVVEDIEEIGCRGVVPGRCRQNHLSVRRRQRSESAGKPKKVHGHARCSFDAVEFVNFAGGKIEAYAGPEPHCLRLAAASIAQQGMRAECLQQPDGLTEFKPVRLAEQPILKGACLLPSEAGIGHRELIF